MSPVSCLVDIATSGRRKKRVRFRDELITTDSSSDLLLGAPTIAGLGVSPCPAALPPMSPDDTHGSSTPYASEAEPWLVRSPLADTWRLPDPSPSHVGKDTDETVSASPPVWWSHKVSVMGVPAPLTVLPSVPCQDAVDIMLHEGFDQVPVVGQQGELLGIVTLRSLMTSLVVQRALPSTAVGEVMSSKLCTLSRDHSLLELSKMLQRHHCALIVHSQRRLTEKGQVAKKAVVIGIVTPTDLLAYLMRSSLSV